ncbi:MAG: hypothetical protein DBX46_03000 [Clostridiales bacterium]|nr:MAG: hypothetical protein DBX46_03000 [Clostridiales bacterium]
MKFVKILIPVVCIVMLMSLCVAGAAQVRYNNTVAPGTSIKVNPTTKKTGGQYATCMHNKTTPAGDNYFHFACTNASKKRVSALKKVASSGLYSSKFNTGENQSGKTYYMYAAAPSTNTGNIVINGYWSPDNW